MRKNGQQPSVNCIESKGWAKPGIRLAAVAGLLGVIVVMVSWYRNDDSTVPPAVATDPSSGQAGHRTQMSTGRETGPTSGRGPSHTPRTISAGDKEGAMKTLDLLTANPADRSTALKTSLGIVEWEDVITEYGRERKIVDFDTMLAVVRQIEEAGGGEMSGYWISLFAAREPLRFFASLDQNSVHDQEAVQGIRAISDLDPLYAFNEAKSRSLRSPLQKSMVTSVIKSWLNQDSLAASQAVLSLREKDPELFRACRPLVGEWLAAKGDPDAAQWREDAAPEK